MSGENIAYIKVKREKARLPLPRQAIQAGNKLLTVKSSPFMKVIPQEGFEVIGNGGQFSELTREVIRQSDNFYAGEKIDGLKAQTVLVSDIQKGKAADLARGAFSNVVLAQNQPEIFSALMDLYKRRLRPAMLIFNCASPLANVHLFLREIYLKPHYHLFRTIPVMAVDYPEGFPLFPKAIKVAAYNGSPRRAGNTKQLLKEEIEKYFSGPYFNVEIADIPEIKECLACGGHQKNCEDPCRVNDGFKKLLPLVLKAEVLLLGSPVYLDGPTARVRAFLSRLSGQAHHNRLSFVGKTAIPLASAWCSGTKTTIVSMMDSLEMLGFNIPGRGTMENVSLWPDGKTRGGVPWDWFWPR